METTALTRELAPDGTVVLRAGRGTFRYRRPRPGVLDIRIEGMDVELTIAIAQHLSQTGKLIQIYSDADLFEARKREG